MTKKTSQSAEKKIMKYLQGRKVQIIATKNAQKITGLEDYKQSANMLTRMEKEGKIKRIKVGVYKLIKTGIFVAPPIIPPKKVRSAEHTNLVVALRKVDPKIIDYCVALRKLVKSKYMVDIVDLQNTINFVSDCYNSRTTLEDACKMVGHQDVSKPLAFNVLLLKPTSETINTEVPRPDEVNSPAHYKDGKIEVIDYIEDKSFGFHLGNVVKYVSRAGKKNPSKLVQDLEKAQWYLSRIINNLKKGK